MTKFSATVQTGRGWSSVGRKRPT